jgi:anti-sigma factor RsiW
VKISCDNASALVPSYLDGELSEEQAAPLREHLLDCPACRELAKQEKSVKRWFSEAREASGVRVPRGFAARVAKLAFAGAQGGVLVPSARRERQERSGSSAPITLLAGRRGERATVLPFVLKLSSAAAALLFVFALAIQRQALPEGSDLDAMTQGPWISDPDLAEDRLEGSVDAGQEEAPEGEEG